MNHLLAQWSFQTSGDFLRGVSRAEFLDHRPLEASDANTESHSVSRSSWTPGVSPRPFYRSLAHWYFFISSVLINETLWKSPWEPLISRTSRPGWPHWADTTPGWREFCSCLLSVPPLCVGAQASFRPRGESGQTWWLWCLGYWCDPPSSARETWVPSLLLTGFLNVLTMLPGVPCCVCLLLEIKAKESQGRYSYQKNHTYMNMGTHICVCVYIYAHIYVYILYMCVCCVYIHIYCIYWYTYILYILYICIYIIIIYTIYIIYVITIYTLYIYIYVYIVQRLL